MENKFRSVRARVTSGLLVALAATSLCSCALLSGREAEERKKQEMVYRMDNAHVFVTPGDLPNTKPYHVLGQLKYTTPFSTDAIDSAKTEVKLKAMALEKYHDTVDAVINENTDVDASGENVIVTGEAVQFDTSADREMMHKMWENLTVSPK